MKLLLWPYWHTKLLLCPYNQITSPWICALREFFCSFPIWLSRLRWLTCFSSLRMRFSSFERLVIWGFKSWCKVSTRTSWRRFNYSSTISKSFPPSSSNHANTLFFSLNCLVAPSVRFTIFWPKFGYLVLIQDPYLWVVTEGIPNSLPNSPLFLRLWNITKPWEWATRNPIEWQ